MIQLSPPLIAGPAEFDEIVRILRPVLEEASERMDCQADPHRLTRAVRPSDGAPADERRMLTLAELLRDLDLGLLAGEANADAPVRWVHISELLDPTPWLSGGELLLTTGMQLESAKRQREFVARLADHQLAGLGVGTGFAHAEVPVPPLKVAAERDFPVFEVPYDVPFIALTEKAFARLVNEQYAVLQRSIAAHERLERIVLAERGLDAVVGALSR